MSRPKFGTQQSQNRAHNPRERPTQTRKLQRSSVVTNQAACGTKLASAAETVHPPDTDATIARLFAGLVEALGDSQGVPRRRARDARALRRPPADRTWGVRRHRG